MHHPTDMIVHTTTFVIPVMEHWLERECVQGVCVLVESVVKFDLLLNITIIRNSGLLKANILDSKLYLFQIFSF